MSFWSGNKNSRMTSSKSYLLKAIYEWISDNQLTPYLLVDALSDSVEVPQDYVDNGKIVLNISMAAVNELELERSHVAFQARFRGIVESVYVPMSAVLAIYAKENGRGMTFEESDNDDLPPPPQPTTPTSIKKAISGKSKGSHLKIVK